MGYTHYWEFNIPKGHADLVEMQYQKAVKDCAQLIYKYNKDREGFERLSGYSAHAKPGVYGGILFNGKGEEAHEYFYLRDHANQHASFNFCKTARKSYDKVVVACLAVLKYRMKGYVQISSDGNREDWKEGVKLANKILNRKIKNPIVSGLNG